MEEGQLTVDGLVLKSRIPLSSMGHALLDLLGGGFLQREKLRDFDDKMLYHYGLTRKGIELAQHIKRQEIQAYLSGEN